MTAADIETPDPTEAEALADLWVSLARGQREHDSHLRAEANRTHVRELIGRYAASERLLVARSGSVTRRSDRETDTVGFVMFRTRSDRYEVDCERGLIENLYVVPDCRREGIGSTLLLAAERRLRERGVEAISLEAMAANESARRFYRRHGYDPHRVELEKPLGDG